MWTDQSFELPEQRLLDAQILDDRLNDDIAIPQFRKGTRRDDPPEGLIPACRGEAAFLHLAPEHPGDKGSRRLGRFGLRIVKANAVSTQGEELGDAPAHRPRPDDADRQASRLLAHRLSSGGRAGRAR